MFFMQPAKFPPEPFSENLKPKRIHYFTAIQLALFVLLYVVKAIKIIAIAFPIVIAACIPFRMYVLPRIFTQKELVMLDGEDEAVKKWLEDEKEERRKAREIEDLEHQEDADEGDDEHEEEDHLEEEKDIVTPLPQTIPSVSPSSKAQQPKTRPRRMRATSAPQGYLFAEPPQVIIRKRVKPREFEDLDRLGGDESGTETDETPAHRRAHRRSTRVKQVSCPTHYLLHEAKRQVDENYFFG